MKSHDTQLVRLIRPLVLLVMLAAQSAVAAELQISVEKIRNGNGKMIVALFDEAAAFEQQHVTRATALIVQDTLSAKMHFTISNLPPGKYALLVHHDENNDGVFNQKGGIPLEGYGFSRNRGRNGAPEFQRAGIEVRESGSTYTTTELIYFR